MKENIFNPNIGDIWWLEIVEQHCLILAEETLPDPDTHRTYKKYIFLQLESGKYNSILRGLMNEHNEGWFRKVA